MITQLVRDFLMLFVTVDPIATVALFVPLTAAATAAEKKRIALRSVATAGAVLLAFLIAGELLLGGLGIRLVSFQLAGGIILFLLGLQMVFGSGIAEKNAAAEPHQDVAIFPLAMPAIASPGAIMAIVLLTDNHRQSFTQQLLTAGVLLVVLLLTWIALLAARHIYRVLGDTGASVLIRVMGLILAALATEQVVSGVEALLKRG